MIYSISHGRLIPFSALMLLVGQQEACNHAPNIPKSTPLRAWLKLKYGNWLVKQKKQNIVLECFIVDMLLEEILSN